MNCSVHPGSARGRGVSGVQGHSIDADSLLFWDFSERG